MAIEPTDARIRSYLLAELPEEERDELEQAYFADDELFDYIRAVEADLIDDYVSGALSDEDHRRFTERFMTSPDRRSRVDLARALQQTMTVADAPRGGLGPLPVAAASMPTSPLEQTMTVAGTPRGGPGPFPAAAVSTPGSLLDRLRELLGLNRPALLAFATVSVVVAVSAVLLLKWPRQGGQVALQDSAGAATLTRDQTIVLARLGTLPPELSSSVRSLITDGSVPPDRQVASAMETLRGATRGTRLTDPPAATPAPLPLSPLQTGLRSDQPTLRWRGVTGARGYTVTVGDRDNKKVWEGTTTAETEATIPPGVLQRGELYFWQVDALANGGSASPRLGFWVVDAETLKQVEDIERAYRGSALVLAATYDRHGLYEEALEQVNQLAQLNPGSAAIQAMLTHLNAQLGR